MNQEIPNTNICPSPQKLADFVNGRISFSDLSEIEIHIENCSHCSAQLSGAPSDSLVKRIESAKLNDLPDGSAKFICKPFELGPDSRYQIIEELGEGGMGQVFKARHKIMKRTVAIKTIRPELMNNTEAIQRFAKEARAAARLSHPNIVSAFDAEQEGDMHFLVMEYVDGESLNRLVNRSGPLDARTAASLIRQAALGLQHASERGMVHRDIKPQNLMLAADGTVKILDFGLSKFRRELAHVELSDTVAEESIQALTLRNTQMGTVGYVSPEQARDASSVDIRSDIYSLGCTFFFLLTNRAPFCGLPPDDLKSVPDISRFRNDLPAGFAEILDRMMQVDPENRFQHPEEIVVALDAIDFESLASDSASRPDKSSKSNGASLMMSSHRIGLRTVLAQLSNYKHALIGIALGLALAALVGWLFLKFFGV